MLEPLRALIETTFSTSLSVDLGYSPRVVALSTKVLWLDFVHSEIGATRRSQNGQSPVMPQQIGRKSSTPTPASAN